MDQEVECPACGAIFVIFVDPKGGEEQRLEASCPECDRTLSFFAKEEERGGFAIAIQPNEEE